LHRRLEQEGTSFKQLLDEARHTRALEYLQAGKFSIKELAYSLGYTDPTNFRRAFRRREGVAPSPVHPPTRRDGDTKRVTL
jgi:AraC-like DNA-binding protein